MDVVEIAHTPRPRGPQGAAGGWAKYWRSPSSTTAVALLAPVPGPCTNAVTATVGAPIGAAAVVQLSKLPAGRLPSCAVPVFAPTATGRSARRAAVPSVTAARMPA